MPGGSTRTYSTCMLGIALTVSIDDQIDGPSRFGVEVIKHSLCQNPFQHKCGGEGDTLMSFPPRMRTRSKIEGRFSCLLRHPQALSESAWQACAATVRNTG